MGRPLASATRGEWDEYAESLDLDPEEYSTKEDLIAAVNAEEEASELLDTGAVDEEEARERSPQWKRAFAHAKAHGNPDKTATLYANSAHRDFKEG